MEPTLQQVFGSGATQTATTITISKADLSTLTASATNTAESLLVAILQRAFVYLTSSNFDANVSQSVRPGAGFTQIVTRGTTSYRIDQIVVELAKIDSQSQISPNDY